MGHAGSTSFGLHYRKFIDSPPCRGSCNVDVLQSGGVFLMTILKTVVSDTTRSLGVKVLAADEFSVQSLMKLGLTEYEARIYVVLSKMGPRNASEISFLGKVPRPKTYGAIRSEEHTSELQSLAYLVCRLLLEKKNK